jgi:hypothetical protein
MSLACLFPVSKKVKRTWKNQSKKVTGGETLICVIFCVCVCDRDCVNPLSFFLFFLFPPFFFLSIPIPLFFLLKLTPPSSVLPLLTLLLHINFYLLTLDIRQSTINDSNNYYSYTQDNKTHTYVYGPHGKTTAQGRPHRRRGRWEGIFIKAATHPSPCSFLKLAATKRKEIDKSLLTHELQGRKTTRRKED